jgi:NADH dehydrogenase
LVDSCAALRKVQNARVWLDQVKRVDLEEKRIWLRNEKLSYDYLILAPGAQTNYFGHDDWARCALGLKTLDDAIEIRRRVLLAFEQAEREWDLELQRRLLTFVIIGGGPTGAELAGSIAELARFALSRDFRGIDSRSAQIILLEGGERILSAFAPESSARARGQLRHLGVDVRERTLVRDVTPAGVVLVDGTLIPSLTVLWAAGVRASPLMQTLGLPLDKLGRVEVEPDLSLRGYPDVFVIGDAASYRHHDGNPLPGIAPVAIQQGQAVARAIELRGRGETAGRFNYKDKGTMATIGRSAAIAEIGRLRLAGFTAWLFWLFVHIMFLIGFRNRAVVMFNWFWSYVSFQRGARLITGGRFEPGALPEPLVESDEGDPPRSTNDARR